MYDFILMSYGLTQGFRYMNKKIPCQSNHYYLDSIEIANKNKICVCVCVCVCVFVRMFIYLFVYWVYMSMPKVE